MLCKFKRLSTFNYTTRIKSICKIPSTSTLSHRSFSLSIIKLNQSSSSDNNNSSSSLSNNNQYSTPSTPSTSSTTTIEKQQQQYTFSLEDLEKVKEELIQNLLNESASSQVPLPSPGKSSGNQSIDEATKQWRLTNTKDDENLQKLFKSTKQKQKATTSLLEQSQMNGINPYGVGDEDFEVGVDEEEFSKYVNPFNPETQEVNGPKGAEPTRFGDWERSGRCFDF